MKSCIVLFVLVTLTTYCCGRTRWRIIESDDVEVGKTKAYKECTRDCLKRCEEPGKCKIGTESDPNTFCLKGSSEIMVDGKPFRGCEHLITHPVSQPDEPKRPFEVADLWKLFEA